MISGKFGIEADESRGGTALRVRASEWTWSVDRKSQVKVKLSSPTAPQFWRCNSSRGPPEVRASAFSRLFRGIATMRPCVL